MAYTWRGPLGKPNGIANDNPLAPAANTPEPDGTCPSVESRFIRYFCRFPSPIFTAAFVNDLAYWQTAAVLWETYLPTGLINGAGDSWNKAGPLRSSFFVIDVVTTAKASPYAGLASTAVGYVLAVFALAAELRLVHKP